MLSDEDVAAMEKFWTDKVEPIIKSFGSILFPYSIIKKRYNTNIDVIKHRYGKKPVIHFVIAPKEKGDVITPMTCAIEDGNVKIRIFLAELMRLYAAMQRVEPVHYRTLFESSVVIFLIHELDHLAYGAVPADEVTYADKIAIEAVAWAQTCEHTIAPLFEVYNMMIMNSDAEMLAEWRRVGKCLSQDWHNVIRSRYGSI